MNHPIPYAENGKDLISWFSGYYKNKYGYYLPNSQWGKQAAFISYMKKKGYSIKDISVLIWGLTLEKDNVRSMWYAKYYTDKLEEYKKLIQKYKEKDEREGDVKKYDTSQFESRGSERLSAKEYFKEFNE